MLVAGLIINQVYVFDELQGPLGTTYFHFTVSLNGESLMCIMTIFLDLAHNSKVRRKLNSLHMLKSTNAWYFISVRFRGYHHSSQPPSYHHKCEYINMHMHNAFIPFEVYEIFIKLHTAYIYIHSKYLLIEYRLNIKLISPVHSIIGPNRLCCEWLA